MKRSLPNEWRTKSKWQLWFYARYMRWLERLGYALLVAVVCAMVFAFTYRVDEVISADGVELALDEATGAVYAEASLKGETAPRARSGSNARLTNLTIQPVAKTLLRASSSSGEWISGSILDDQFVRIIEEGIIGVTLQTRLDPALRVESVEEIAVDARVRTSLEPGQGESGLEPSISDELAGRVVSGKHLAEVQVSQIPEDVRSRAADAVRGALIGRTFTLVEGGSGAPLSLESVHFVVKVKAEPGGSSTSPTTAAPVSREFQARIDLSDPPEYLISALRSGRKVLCRVEVKTGQKPIALTLLKKS